MDGALRSELSSIQPCFGSWLGLSPMLPGGQDSLRSYSPRLAGPSFSTPHSGSVSEFYGFYHFEVPEVMPGLPRWLPVIEIFAAAS